jgi:hypothetical protein
MIFRPECGAHPQGAPLNPKRKPEMIRNLLSSTWLIAALMVPSGARAADPVLPPFDSANFSSPKPNPYVPLVAGVSQTMRGTRTDGEPIPEHGVITVQGPGPVVLGVQTVTVLDEAFEDGVLVERTFDYFANDNAGNLWYFGEDVTNYRYDDAGNLISTDSESAWRAGVNGAQPGISVPGTPTVGLTLFQEHAPEDEAMDYAEVLAVDLEITGPGGTYTGVLKTFETSTVETDLREFKYYAPGKGMIRADEELSEALDNPAIIIELQP